MPPFTANQWAPISRIDKLLPLAFIVMAVDMLESTSIARALARKNGYGAWWCVWSRVVVWSRA
jgi:sulfate transporter 4